MVFIRYLLLSVFLALFPAMAFADDLPPSEEGVCDSLLDGTAGLFGLCNAYCEAQDCDEYAPGDQTQSCQRLLVNYLRKSDGADPPCLVDEEPSCPCWTTDQMAEAPEILADLDDPYDLDNPVFAFCEADGGPAPPVPGDPHYDGALYFRLILPTLYAISFENFEGGCQYFNSVQGTSTGFLETTPAQNQACQDDLHGLFLVDFGGTEENPHAGCLAP